MGIADVQPGEPAPAKFPDDGVPGQAVVDLAGEGQLRRRSP